MLITFDKKIGKILSSPFASLPSNHKKPIYLQTVMIIPVLMARALLNDNLKFFLSSKSELAVIPERKREEEFIKGEGP